MVVRSYPLGDASFSGASLALFEYTAAPTLWSIEPPSGYAGMRVTLNMSLASESPPRVWLGDAPCIGSELVATDATTMLIACNVTKAPPASVTVHALVPEVGWAVGDLSFQHEIAITGISPSIASAGELPSNLNPSSLCLLASTDPVCLLPLASAHYPPRTRRLRHCRRRAVSQ